MTTQINLVKALHTLNNSINVDKETQFMSWFNNENIGATDTASEKVHRFRMKDGESKEFTFLDGATVNLTVNGETIADVPTPLYLSEYRVTVPKESITALAAVTKG